MTFEKVAIKARKRWKDPATGKSHQATREFSQTLNPFNTTAAGRQKSREQIMVEIKRERDLWLAQEPA
jgi:hypothetical protein